MEETNKQLIAEYILIIIGLLIGLCIFTFVSYKLFRIFNGDTFKENKAEVVNVYNTNYTNIESFKNLLLKDKQIKSVIRYASNPLSKRIEFRINDKIFTIYIPLLSFDDEFVHFLSGMNSYTEMIYYLDDKGISKDDLVKIANFLIQNNLKGMGGQEFWILFNSDIYLKWLPDEKDVKKENSRIIQNLGFDWYMVIP